MTMVDELAVYENIWLHPDGIETSSLYLVRSTKLE